MRIGFFSDTYLPIAHGIENSMEWFRKDLESRGHEVFVFAPHYPGYKDENPNVIRFRSMRILLNRPVRLTFHSPKDSRNLAHIPLDIAHAHSTFSLGNLGRKIARQRNIPFVYTHHSNYSEYAKLYYPEHIVLPWIAKKYTRWFCNRADGIVAPTLKMQHTLEGIGVTKPITVIPTGLTSFPAYSAESRARIRKKLQIPENAAVFIYVGRLEKSKNIEYLLNAFKIAKQNAALKNAVLIVVGQGPDRERLEKTASELPPGFVHFAGRVPNGELDAYYYAADAFSFASWITETQCIVIAEALSHALPVIVMKDELFEQAITHGQNGFLAQKNNPADFAGYMVKLATDRELRKELSQNALQSSRQFAQNLQTDKLLAFYKKLSQHSP